MRVSRRGLAPILFLLAGCGEEDRTGRMAPGVTATVHGEGGEPAPAFFHSKTEMLPEGTIVRVISDGEGGPAEARRKVVVGIQGGPSSGLAGLMYRSDLRPEE